MTDNRILRISARFLIPLILLFGLYIQFHGEYSPGGGFQAGVVFSAGWILFALIYGLDAALEVIPERALYVLMVCGATIYAGVGVATVLLGGHFLDYYALHQNPHASQQLGITAVELGVGLTVASVMMMIFNMFARRKRDRDDDPDEEGS